MLVEVRWNKAKVWSMREKLKDMRIFGRGRQAKVFCGKNGLRPDQKPYKPLLNVSRISPKKAAEILLRRVQCLTNFIVNARMIPPLPPAGDRVILEKLLQSSSSQQKQHSPAPTSQGAEEADAVNGSSGAESESMPNMTDGVCQVPAEDNQNLDWTDNSDSNFHNWDAVSELLGNPIGTLIGTSTGVMMDSSQGDSLLERSTDETAEGVFGDNNMDIDGHILLDQISNRMGHLHLMHDGQLRYYGATSNFNLGGSIQDDVPKNAPVVITPDTEQATMGENIDPGEEAHLEALFFHWQDPAYHVVYQPMYYHGKALWRNGKKESPFYSSLLTNAMYEISLMKSMG